MGIGEFHFIRPEWLLMLPVAFLLWFALKRVTRQGQWQDYIPKEMLTALQVTHSSQSNLWQSILLITWLILIVAAAGPSWDKQAVPTLENQKALAIVLDLSPSMLAEDLTPNRLTRARYKLIDILRKQQDGQFALIAYAGDAHTVSPLTDDPRTIEALLPALHPGVMPTPGSNTEAGITLAQKLLDDAGAPNGDILLISDGVTAQAARNIRKQLSVQHRLSILAIGGSEAAPVPVKGGGFLRNTSGEIVLASVNIGELRDLANAAGGRFASIRNDESDIENLLLSDFQNTESTDSQSETSYDAWTDNGHWLVLLILPLIAWFFRRGFIYVFPLFFLLPMNSEAAEEKTSIWSKLWQTPDQQAAKLFEKERYDDAAKTFQNDDWSAIANYRNGDYQQAASQLEGKDDVTSLYNRGNALAFNGDLEEAIKAYEKVLEQQPKHANAAHNKDVLEKLQQQQQSQQNKDSQDGEQGNEPQDKQQQDQQPSSDQQDSESSEQDQSQSSEQESSEQESSEQESSEQESSEQESSEQESSEQQADSNNPQNDQAQANQQQTNEEKSKQEETQEEQQAKAEQDQKEGEELESEKQDSKETGEPQTSMVAAEESPTPLKDSSEQWLRTIQDDPSGFLRRKFEYQSWQRQQSGERGSNNKSEERY